MRHHTTGLVLATLGALALSACGEKTETKTTTTTKTTAAVDGVARKAGLWEQTTDAEGLGSATTKICLGSSVEPCPGANVVKTADGYTVSATCKTGANGTVAVETVAKGDLQGAYTLTSKATISGAPAAEMNRTINTTVKLRWLGACPEGMTVGQIQSDDGAVVDMSNFDAAKARELAKQAGGK
jgi:hypothetical protein